RENKNVLPVFIFDTEILNALEDKTDKRVQFIHHTLSGLKQKLETLGSSLALLYGNPVHLFTRFAPKAVYTNHDYEPDARRREEQVSVILKKKGVALKTFKDLVIFEKDEVVKSNGTPYTLFTPYSKKWKAQLKPFYYKSYPTEKYYASFKKCEALPAPALAKIGFVETDTKFPERTIRQSILEQYHKTRDFPSLNGTTRLSIHLRFGTLSIRKLIPLALKKNVVWQNELIWREFYQMILWHFPGTRHAFKPGYDQIKWRNNEQEFEAWCAGKTGYPIVDAGMRELNETGFMHNRVRMITASFLVKHLLIDWRWGEAYFARKLLDFDLAANNGNWQWTAGCGCDAAPYFRVFNPYLQTKKFDPELTYIKKWVPEYNSPGYPKPVVDHDVARARVLKAYREALNR
ncbi:MAG TPA: deoxyribodipyrimidine photo-lyase, partial [Cyclobacteriaceae bacterium]|nr:deoxyribodipyrimidine photo-lyase [Cyclobacteriaceae bacterium]